MMIAAAIVLTLILFGHELRTESVFIVVAAVILSASIGNPLVIVAVAIALWAMVEFAIAKLKVARTSAAIGWRCGRVAFAIAVV